MTTNVSNGRVREWNVGGVQFWLYPDFVRGKDIYDRLNKSLAHLALPITVWANDPQPWDRWFGFIAWLMTDAPAWYQLDANIEAFIKLAEDIQDYDLVEPYTKAGVYDANVVRQAIASGIDPELASRLIENPWVKQ